jgi:hypothetical protein
MRKTNMKKSFFYNSHNYIFKVGNQGDKVEAQMLPDSEQVDDGPKTPDQLIKALYDSLRKEANKTRARLDSSIGLLGKAEKMIASANLNSKDRISIQMLVEELRGDIATLEADLKVIEAQALAEKIADPYLIDGDLLAVLEASTRGGKFVEALLSANKGGDDIDKATLAEFVGLAPESPKDIARYAELLRHWGSLNFKDAVTLAKWVGSVKDTNKFLTRMYQKGRTDFHGVWGKEMMDMANNGTSFDSRSIIRQFSSFKKTKLEGHLVGKSTPMRGLLIAAGIDADLASTLIKTSGIKGVDLHNALQNIAQNPNKNIQQVAISLTAHGYNNAQMARIILKCCGEKSDADIDSIAKFYTDFDPQYLQGLDTGKYDLTDLYNADPRSTGKRTNEILKSLHAESVSFYDVITIVHNFSGYAAEGIVRHIITAMKLAEKEGREFDALAVAKKFKHNPSLTPYAKLGVAGDNKKLIRVLGEGNLGLKRLLKARPELVSAFRKAEPNPYSTLRFAAHADQSAPMRPTLLLTAIQNRGGAEKAYEALQNLNGIDSLGHTDKKYFLCSLTELDFSKITAYVDKFSSRTDSSAVALKERKGGIALAYLSGLKASAQNLSDFNKFLSKVEAADFDPATITTIYSASLNESNLDALVSFSEANPNSVSDKDIARLAFLTASKREAILASSPYKTSEEFKSAMAKHTKDEDVIVAGN